MCQGHALICDDTFILNSSAASLGPNLVPCSDTSIPCLQKTRQMRRDKPETQEYIAEPRGSQGTQTRGTWDVCITERCSSIKN